MSERNSFTLENPRSVSELKKKSGRSVAAGPGFYDSHAGRAGRLRVWPEEELRTPWSGLVAARLGVWAIKTMILPSGNGLHFVKRQLSDRVERLRLLSIPHIQKSPSGCEFSIRGCIAMGGMKKL
jgi:hypothetical protein